MPENKFARDGDLTKAVAARMLHWLLLGTITFCVLHVMLVVPLFAYRKVASAVLSGILLAVAVVCMFLLRRDRSRESSWLFLSAGWLILSLLVVLSGGIESPALLGHIPILVVAGWLVGRRGAIWIGVASLSFVLAIALLAAVGTVFPEYFPIPPMAAWELMLALVSLAILPLSSVSRALVDAAKETRRELQARRLEERARAESDERFRMIFLHAAVGIAQTSLDGKFLLVNDRFCQILGYTANELAGMTFLDVTHPDDRTENRLARQKMTAGEISSWSAEKRYVRKDGSLVWGRLDVSLVRDPEGEPRCFIAAVEDISQRVQAENNLRESERRLALALRAANQDVWDCDLRKDEVRMSTKDREVHHADPLSRAEWLARVHPDDRERVLKLVDDSLAGGSQWDAEFRVVLPESGFRWVHSCAITLVDEADRPIRMVGVSQDVTERKQAEALLRESEERFRNMADTAPVMIWVTGRDKGCTFVNRTWLDFTGRTMEEELGFGWAARVHPDDRDRNYTVFSAAFDARQTFQVESRWLRADGEYRLVLCTGIPRFAPGGEFAGYIGSKIDITDLQSEMRFRQLAENIDQVFWMLDLDTERVLYVSPAFEKVWGISSAGLQQQNPARLLDTVHPEDRDRCEAFLARLQAEPAEESYRIIRPDGSVRWIHDRAFLIYRPDGRPYRVAGIAEDVTAHRELEESFRQSQKMEAIGRLAGGIAHDFNNLLTVVGGYLQMVLDATPPSDPRHEKLKHILSASNRATRLTSQLLAFSRKQIAQPKLVNVNNLLTNMEALLRPVMGEQIHLLAELAGGLPCVKADPNQLEQVVMNLAANARDAMPEGGEFRIRTALLIGQADPRSGRDLGPCVRIQVSDTGCGMSRDVLEHVFEPFFTTKGVGKGTGLGLSTVYGIIQQNHGAIHVASSPGSGTTFDILLPAAMEGEEFQSAATPLESLHGSETILVAEDEPGVRQLVCDTLEQLGYKVLRAADGREALRVLEQHGAVQLLLTDVIMPGMGGPELARRVRTLMPGTRVVYMSGYTDDTLAFYGLPQSGTSYIQKPFTPAALAEKLRHVMSTTPRLPIDLETSSDSPRAPHIH
jgi:PAS domain S-box-containing protein